MRTLNSINDRRIPAYQLQVGDSVLVDDNYVKVKSIHRLSRQVITVLFHDNPHTQLQCYSSLDEVQVINNRYFSGDGFATK